MSLKCPGVLLTKYCLYDYYSPMELRHTSCLSHQGQERKGCSLCGLCMFAGFHWVVGEYRLCSTLNLFGKAGRKMSRLTCPGLLSAVGECLFCTGALVRLEVGEGQDHLPSPALDWEWGSLVTLCCPASAGVGAACPSLPQQGSRRFI